MNIFSSLNSTAAFAVALSAGAAEPPSPPKTDPVAEASLQALQSEVQLPNEFTQNILATGLLLAWTSAVVLLATIGCGWADVRVMVSPKIQRVPVAELKNVYWGIRVPGK